MTTKQLKRANDILDNIKGMQYQLEKLSHILNKDEFDFLIEDRWTGNSYRFSNDFLPKDFYKFIGDYSKKIEAEVVKYEEEFKNL